MKIGKETWVEIHDIVLKPEERTGNLPEETKKVPLEMRLKGFLLEEAELGDRVKIRTVTGRIVEGTLLKENPVYEHGYGETFIPELLTIGQNLRAMLEVDHE
ncbi:MAG: 2-amino-4-ketopentanoate thiolase [Clostridia bacterium]|uniref:2-amino-4-ketopentanoate thiolase n=1 Tax=Proteiniclasticum aestuarii TaxID=2817862 RepID=A0A939H594_9CLOT|nr:2-amino-4-oxopentanoate thiolase subunit OrtA [Proteiniclasticum aestuarii]MBO1264467.1 2-amino-4-ketopentanoate thiolase [Proteiniclasticum aestuarii]NCC79509.1 2-amino-4-ketopentanoate thiolase [Clostridia bacterium]